MIYSHPIASMRARQRNGRSERAIRRMFGPLYLRDRHGYTVWNPDSTVWVTYVPLKD